MRRLVPALLLLATTATAVTAATRPDATRIEHDWKSAVPAGAAIDCVQRSAIRETRVRDDRTIDFVMQGGKVYRNTLPYACPQLGFEQAFGYETSLDRLCSVDIITVVRTTGGMARGPSCGLGQFQPVVPGK